MRKLICFLLAWASIASAQTAKHVVLIALENHGYSQVIGNLNMPYLNQLAKQGALATNFYATGHPSIDNYFRLTTGQNVSFDDSFSGTTSVNNFVRQMAAVGKTWKAYSENLPYTGYLGGDNNGYVKHHNPFAYMTDVRNSSTQTARLVNFSKFDADLSAGALPSFTYIQPNNSHNGHNCPTSASCTDTDKLVAVDNWLLSHVPKILNDPDFAQDGLLIIWFDEGKENDTANGGGKIAVVFAGPAARDAYKSTTFYRHDHLLRTLGAIFGFKSFPGASANVASMTDMLATSGNQQVSGVTISSPASGASVGSPTQVSGKASVSGMLAYFDVWVDGVKKYTTKSSTLDTYVSLSSGSHRFVLMAGNTAGAQWKQTVYATVSGAPSPTLGVTMLSPADGSTVGSPVHVSAQANVSGTFSAMELWVDGAKKYASSSASLDKNVTLPAGKHRFVVIAKNAAGTQWQKVAYATVK